MTTLVITRFSGQVPRRTTKLQPANFAQVAINCRLTSGGIKPWPSPQAVTTLSPGT